MPTKNPYVDGALKFNGSLSSVIKTGKDETQYISASETYVPVWMECGGVKIYNCPSEQVGLHEIDNIRYYNTQSGFNLICVNDVFAALKLNYSFDIGKYQELGYIEIIQ